MSKYELNYGKVYNEVDTGFGFVSSFCGFDTKAGDFYIEPFTDNEYKNYPLPENVTAENFIQWVEENYDSFHQHVKDIDFFIEYFKEQFLGQAEKAA